MISLDEALHRLLTRRSYRAALLDGQWSRLDVCADDIDALGCVDPTQLSKTAAKMARDLMHRQYRGSGGLRQLYPKTISAWLREQPEDDELLELAYRFMESDGYRGYKEHPHAGDGICLEEAFFLFCEQERIGDAVEREREFLAAVIRALAVNSRPCFSIPASVKTISDGFVAMARRNEPTMYATRRGKIIQGTLTPFLAELVMSSDAAADIAQRHGVDPAVLNASLRHLAELGLRLPAIALTR